MKQNKLIVRVKRAELIEMLDELVELERRKSSPRFHRNGKAKPSVNEVNTLLAMKTNSAHSKSAQTQKFMNEFIQKLESFILPEDKYAPDKYTLCLDTGTFQRYNRRKQQLSQRLASELTKCISDNGHTTRRPVKVRFALGTYDGLDISDKESNSYLEIDCEFNRENSELSPDFNCQLSIENCQLKEASLITADKTYRLTKPRTSIGRRESNDIVVSNLMVSRNHAEIIVDAGKFILKDLSSRNGTYLNGKRIETVEIKSNDIISLDRAGKISFRFEIAEKYAVIPSENFLEHFNRGLELRREKRWDSATKEFLEAIRLGDKSARPYFNIAVIKFHQRDYEQSIENFQKGLEIEPDNASAHADLGKVYQITEQWGKAIEHFQKALEIESNHQAAKRRLSRIEEVYKIYQEADGQLSEQKSKSQRVVEDEFSLDLMIGAEVQQRLMPEVPDLPGLDIAASTIPARGVSGDYYDFIHSDNQHLWIVVADVSGKSIGGAILMSETRSLLRTNIKHGLTLEAVIAQVNNTIYEDTADDKFITMFIGALDTSNKTFEYCNVGHNPPVLYRNQSKEPLILNVGGPVAGVLPDAPYETERINLENGDVLVLYTDGITEAMNEAEELFGEERLHKLCAQNVSLEAQPIIEAISNQVKEFSAEDFEDDATLVVVKVNEYY